MWFDTNVPTLLWGSTTITWLLWHSWRNPKHLQHTVHTVSDFWDILSTSPWQHKDNAEDNYESLFEQSGPAQGAEWLVYGPVCVCVCQRDTLCWLITNNRQPPEIKQRQIFDWHPLPFPLPSHLASIRSECGSERSKSAPRTPGQMTSPPSPSSPRVPKRWEPGEVYHPR